MTDEYKSKLRVGDKIICKDIDDVIAMKIELEASGVATIYDNKGKNSLKAKYVLRVVGRIDDEQVGDEFLSPTIACPECPEPLPSRRLIDRFKDLMKKTITMLMQRLRRSEELIQKHAKRRRD